MTNVRITAEFVDEWRFCPYCGRKLQLDQSPDLLFRTDDGIDVDKSEDAGFDFQRALSGCGYHIRLWVPEDGEPEIE